jgi:ubiquinone/menaquinone biosynthesis C-methylase UbiE
MAGMRPLPARELAAYGGAPLFRGKRVLDIGTGDGRLALGTAASAREVVGLDPDPEAIRGARSNARRAGARNARFVVGPAQELPFPDGSFDVVILSWTL